MKKFLISTVFASQICGFGLAHAEQVAAKTVDAAAQSAAPTHGNADVSISAPFTSAYWSPTLGAVTFGVSRDNPLFATPIIGQAPVLSPDFSTSYLAQSNGGLLGLTAGFTNGGSLYTAAPTAGWNFGASVGYAGFYVHGGFSDASQLRLLNDPSKGWLAGFGYQAGAFNVRLSYMTAQTLNANDPDSRTWMIGGIYQLSPRVRLNADAFTSRETHLNATQVAPPANVAAPQGTGARVGVQLQF